MRYSFTKGTQQEIDFIVEALGLRPGERVLDIGCGPGRHTHELARRGLLVHGVDISQRFVDLATASAPPGATFARLDARHLPFREQFDAAICLCQGAFGLLATDDENMAVLSGIATALKPGGTLALSAFSSYFAVKYHESAAFDASAGISHERTEVRNEDGEAVEVDLWTTCFTPRELRLMYARAGFEVPAVWSVEPGRYEAVPPSTETPEFLVIGRCG